MRIFVFDIDLDPEAFLDLAIQVCQSMEINGSLVHRRLVVSKQKFSQVGVCARTKLGEFQKSAGESVSDINVSAARRKSR